jgi:hypothetical protein
MQTCCERVTKSFIIGAHFAQHLEWTLELDWDPGIASWRCSVCQCLTRMMSSRRPCLLLGSSRTFYTAWVMKVELQRNGCDWFGMEVLESRLFWGTIPAYLWRDWGKPVVTPVRMSSFRPSIQSCVPVHEWLWYSVAVWLIYSLVIQGRCSKFGSYVFHQMIDDYYESCLGKVLEGSCVCLFRISILKIA